MQNEMPGEIYWMTHEGPKNRKTVDWHWIVVALSFAIIIIAALDGNTLLAIFTALASVAIIIQGRSERKELHVRIFSQGIQINKELFPFSNIKTFWINELRDPHILSLYIDRVFISIIKIPIIDTDPSILRKFLRKKIVEEEHKENIIDLIADRLDL